MDGMNGHRSLAGRTALVTGAGSGLGAAVACAIGRAGGAVALLDLDETAAARSAAGIDGADTLPLACDVSSPEAVDLAVAAALDRWGHIDIAVNCAGYDVVKSAAEMSVEEWDRITGVNLRGPFLVARAVWPAMQRQQDGHIVNVASTAALRAWGNASAYHASKFGLVGLGRGLGVEGRPDNIRVTTVIPGGMNTNWFSRFPEQGIPLPDTSNLQDPATVAEAILFALTLPRESVMQEFLLTPLTETSWP
jgi:NAD(P)-dependent dehydrogenase (short-subunit alcohol dehydrogenase family)